MTGEAELGSDRPKTPFVADERTMLDNWLEFHRATLWLKCEGLSDEQLKLRSVAPSTISLLGLVRHMAEVERSWFRRTFAGEDAPAMYYSDDDPDGDFDGVDQGDVATDVAIWRREVDAARQILAAADSLDAVGVWQRHDKAVSLRWIMVHMIEEYARHNGHADFLRERIDGATGQ